MIGSPSFIDFTTYFYRSDQITLLPKPEWLIRGILPKNSNAMLAGPPNAGKSFLALDWAYHLGLGIDWQGHKRYKIRQRYPVYYIAGEGSGALSNRAAVWCVQNGVSFGEDCGVNFLTRAANIASDMNGGENEVTWMVNAWHKMTNDSTIPGLVIFDTLARCADGADESSSQDMGQVITNMDTLRRTWPGCTVLLIHHPGYSTGKRPRGSSAVPAGIDTDIWLEDVGKAKPTWTRPRKLQCGRIKDMNDFGDIQISFKKRILVEETEDEDEQGSLALDEISLPGEKLAAFSSLTAIQQMTLRTLVDKGAPQHLGMTNEEWYKATQTSPEKGPAESTFHSYMKDFVAQGMIYLGDDDCYSPSDTLLEQIYES